MNWFLLYINYVIAFQTANQKCLEGSQVFQHHQSPLSDYRSRGSIPKQCKDPRRLNRCKRGFELKDSKLVFEEQAPGKALVKAREEQALSVGASNRLGWGSKRKRTLVMKHRQMATTYEKPNRPFSGLETTVLTSAVTFLAEPGSAEIHSNFIPPTVPRACDWDEALSPKLHDRSVIFHRILREEFCIFQKNNNNPIDKGLSPVVSYFAIQLSRVLEKGMFQEAKSYMSKHLSASLASLGFSQEFVLPFCYQLLLTRPSYAEWQNIMDLFIKFHTRWCFMIVVKEDFHSSQLVSFREAILEKSAKMFQWISEVLKNAYVPEFIQNVATSRKNLFETKVHHSGRIRGSRNLQLLSGLYEWLGGVQTIPTHHKASRAAKNLADLLLLWKNDCLCGYPKRLENEIGNRVIKETLQGSMLVKSSQKVWENWCQTILNIQRSAIVCERAMAPKIPKQSMKKFFLSEGDFSVWDALLCPCGNEDRSSQRGKLMLWLEKFNVGLSKATKDMLDTVPQVIWKQLDPTDTLEKLEYFSKRKDRWFSHQYFPDEIETFFCLNELLGGKIKDFMDGFKRYEHRAWSKSQYYHKKFKKGVKDGSKKWDD